MSAPGRMRRSATKAGLLFLPLGVCGSTAALAASDTQIWIGNAAVVTLSDRWRLSEEITTRISDDKGGLYEIETDTLLGYRLNKFVTVWAGYTFDPQFSKGEHTATEHRAREQVAFANVMKLGPGMVSARLRTEQRWRSNASGTALRVRPFVRYTIPLDQGGRTGVNFTSEPFFNLNTTSFQSKHGLDRMRNLVAVVTPLGKNLNGEIGYMNQHIFVSNGPDESDNIAWISVSATF